MGRRSATANKNCLQLCGERRDPGRRAQPSCCVFGRHTSSTRVAYMALLSRLMMRRVTRRKRMSLQGGAGQGGDRQAHATGAGGAS